MPDERTGNVSVGALADPHGDLHAPLLYRPDIDGLRALAVLPVVLGHANVLGFSGGFVGVDIFFVISGYLITAILVRDLRTGSYSIGGFYRRRILRIFPALFVIAAITTAIAALTLLPVELVRYARSLGATAMFSSNLLFYLESDYFGAASATKPLLHTWSLAVEEQFYMLWPLLLAAIGTHPFVRLRWAVGGITILSFIFAVTWLSIDASFTFYMLPARVWELSIGAMLALGRNPVRRRWANEALAAIGVLCILFCIWRYDAFTPFPGLTAALPCVGAALIIMTGQSRTMVSRLLSTAPPVFVGKISYSLYLWHWPVIIFAQIALFMSVFDTSAKAAQVAASVLLGYLSWRFVEQPFRIRGQRWSTRQVLIAGVVAILAALGVALALIAAEGLPQRFTEEQRALGSYLDSEGEALYRRGTCFQVAAIDHVDARCLQRRSSRPSLLLLGDSHAAHLWPGFAADGGRYEVLQATMAGCRPVSHSNPRTSCRQFMNRMLTKWAPTHRPAAVLLAGNWRMEDMAALDRALADPAIRAVNPILIGPIPQYTTALPRLLAFNKAGSGSALPAKVHLEIAFEVDARMREIAVRHDTAYISLIDTLCRRRACRTRARPGVPLQFDYSHLTREGSIIVIEAITPRIAALLRSKPLDSETVR